MKDTNGLKSVIIVTGGCGDIGGTTARKLAASGAQVIVFDLLDEDAGSRLVRELGAVDYLCVDRGTPSRCNAVSPRWSKNLGG